MSKFNAAPLTLLALLLTMLALTATPYRPAAAKDAEQVGGEYVALAREIAQATSGDSVQVVENASATLQDFSAKLRVHEEAGKDLKINPSKMVRANKRLIPNGDIIEVVFELGAAGENLRVAKAWGALAVREEGVKLANARREVKARNQAELARVYQEVQARILDRESASMQLWALASGRAYVRVTETYSSGAGSSTRGRAATPLEAQQFAAGLIARANAPIRVDPAHFIRVRDIHTIDQLRANKQSFGAVADLKVRVDGELTRFAEAHAKACQTALASKDEAEQCRAMMSLGWWNGHTERAAVEAALEHKSEQLKGAAFAALHRLRPSPDALKRLAKRESAEIRREAAILAGECLGDTKSALEVARDLTLDSKPEVRQAAYASLNSLLAISNSTPLRALSFSKSALESQKPEITVEAIQWISLLDDQGDPAFGNQRRLLLLPLASHRILAISAAASQALR